MTRKKKKRPGRDFNQPHVSINHSQTLPKLEIVLKCESSGSLEAVKQAILDAAPEGVEIIVFHTGIGDVNKSDIFMAESGSRLIIGYDVDIIHNIEPLLSDHGIEVRLYDVIYRLSEDVRNIADSLVSGEDVQSKSITGKAKVIALFKSSRKGIILGCEVEEGHLLAHGDQFQVIAAMGPVYSGKIESLHIKNDAVQVARIGQQVGLKIKNFKQVSVGDIVESFRITSKKKKSSWHPQGILFKHMEQQK